ncbi:MAG: SpoIIE family protein phosphatase [Treponema sp.]|nr:SpoIIE family protein phosphatase [Treponema sp.]
MWQKIRPFIFSITIISALFMLSACSVEKPGSFIYFHNGLEYAPATQNESIADFKASGKIFTKFSTDSKHNLDPYKEDDESFLWVRITFSIPESLQNQKIGLVIPYLHFSEIAWLNEHYIGQYGSFPPNAYAAQYEAHFFSLPEEFLIQGQNEILIKVYCKGYATISGKIFIGKEDACKRIAKSITFIKAKVYFIFMGVMAAAAIVFFLIYFNTKEYSSFFAFALLNTITIILINPFISSENPLYTSHIIPYLTFMKFSMYSLIPYAIFSATEFMLMYMKYYSPKWLLWTRISVTIIPSATVFFINDYSLLMKLCRPIVIIQLLHLSLGIIIPILNVKNEEDEKKLQTLITGFTPLLCSMFLDFILKVMMKDDLLPYFIVFGFLITDIVFFISLTLEFSRLSRESLRTNRELDLEIKKQTRRLSEAKENLESEIRKSNIELEMASVVQHGFLPAQSRTFRNFDFSIMYEPLRIVSGDFYDYYLKGNNLDGFCLFDVSGHGIAASLITLLGKNVVKECFAQGTGEKQKINETLKEINLRISEQKGIVENYLTGLLFRIDRNTYEKESTRITFADAGHPHPILYRAETRDIIELKPDKSQSQFGAVGLFSTDVSFAESSFDMKEGDILLCYTDGLTEAFNKNREQFGLERVKHIISSNAGLNAKDLQKTIYDELKLFTNHAPKEDDLTYIIIKKTKTEMADAALEELNSKNDYSSLEEVDEDEISEVEDLEELEEL